MPGVPVKAQEKLEAARMLIRMHWPYLGDRVGAFRPVPSPGMHARMGGAVATTPRNVLLYDPEALEAWTPAQLAAILAGHEAMHHAHRHFDRANAIDGLDWEEWGKAADAAINDVTQACLSFIGAEDPAGAPVTAASLGMPPGQVAEQYYAELMARKPKKKPEEPREGGDGNGGPSKDTGDTDSHGRPLPPEEQQLNQEHGEDPANAERDDDKAHEAMQAAKAAGKLPASMARVIGEARPPKPVNWRAHMRRAVLGAVRRAGMVDLTFSRPSRLQAAAGWDAILPSWTGKTPKVAVYVDTSGSMGGAELANAGKHLDDIIKAARCDVLVTSCDAAIHGSGKARSFAEAQSKGLIYGGGGTDFGPIFDHVRSLQARERPNLAIILTDGCGPAPAQKPPGLDVVWVLIGSKHRPCPWGTFVEVPHVEVPH